MNNTNADVVMDVSIQKIFETIEHDFAMVKQWKGMESWAPVIEYETRIQCLIELIEVLDCGSRGGYDSRDPQRGRHEPYSIRGLRSRFEWLKELRNK